jgi:hypothetical protein
VVLLGCQRPQEQPAPAADARRTEWTREAASALDHYVVSVVPAPDPIPLNEFFDLQITVADASNRDRPLTGIAVAVDATMPAHGHGMNTTASVLPDGNGFKASGLLLHMPGEWQIWVDVGPERERSRFTLTVP